MNDRDSAGGAPTDEERARAALEQLKSVHAFDLAYEMMIGLVSFGYQKLGLTDDTRPARDLNDARLSIELLRATLAVIEREQGEERTRDLHATLAQMQMAYARVVQLAGAAPPPIVAEPAVADVAGETTPSQAADEEAPPGAAGVPSAEGTPVDEPPAKPRAARRPAAKKPTTKKPAAKKPAVKKPAPNKPAREG